MQQTREPVMDIRRISGIKLKQCFIGRDRRFRLLEFLARPSKLLMGQAKPQGMHEAQQALERALTVVKGSAGK